MSPTILVMCVGIPVVRAARGCRFVAEARKQYHLNPGCRSVCERALLSSETRARYRALEVLSETQSTEFSLPELARRAGVAHNAP